MNQELLYRIDELEERIAKIEQYLNMLEHVTARMVDEKIEDATSGLVTIEEVRHELDL